MNVKWHLVVVLICIFLMSNDVEPLFICLSDICMSVEKSLLSSLPIFQLVCWVFIVEMWTFFISSDRNLVSNIRFVNIFCHL